MAGYCIICKNLDRFEIFIDGKKIVACECLKKKYYQDDLVGYHLLTSVIKQGKLIKEIQENCDSWDDTLKGKKVE